MFTLMICAILQACGGGGGGAGGNDTGKANLIVVPSSGEPWNIVPALDVGMDAAKLQLAISTLPAPETHRLASMLVLRHGKPVIEQYWNGYSKDSLHDLRSATKSITSLMTGIAIDQGFLSSEHELLSARLGAAYPGAPALQEKITLAHLLTMSSGLACDDFTAGSPGNEEKMYQTTDWVKFIMDLPSIYQPGAATRYCTGGVVTLGRVIADASQRPIPEFAETFLFGPLGVVGARWADFDHHRQTDTGGHLHLRPRDMAKIGQLVLQQGRWNGKQLVPAAWIAQSTSAHVKYRNGRHYGYLWWIDTVSVNGRAIDLHYADGNGGQFIFVVPALDLVVVFTGENYNSASGDQGKEILVNHILPAVQN